MVDASNPAFGQQIVDVEKVLIEIGAAEIAQLMVSNKIDRLSVDGITPRASLVRDDTGKICEVRLSAASGDGIDLLRVALSELSAAHALDLTHAVGHVGGQKIAEPAGQDELEAVGQEVRQEVGQEVGQAREQKMGQPRRAGVAQPSEYSLSNVGHENCSRDTAVVAYPP